MKLILADDHQILREGLRGLLGSQDNIIIVGEAADGLEVMELVEQQPVDIVVMDVSMPKLNGIDATKKLKKKYPHIKIIILSIHAEKNIIKNALAAGADAYLLKSCAFTEINDAIQSVVAGENYISPQVASLVISDLMASESNSKEKHKKQLTNRERLILQGIAEGKRSKEIAIQLKIGHRSIDKGRSELMEKLNLHTVAELTKYAIQQGITTIDY